MKQKIDIMWLKINIILILVLLVSGRMLIYGQNTEKKKGDSYFNAYSYAESIKEYEAIPNKTIEIYRRLAISYQKIGNTDKAEDYWKAVVESEERTTEDIYSYAFILSMNKKYSESERWMDEFIKLDDTDSRGRLWAENRGFYESLQQDNGRFQIESLEINNKQEDFGASYYKDKIVFVSTRQSIKMIKRQWNWNQLPFLDLFIAETDSNLQFKTIELFHRNINKKYHEGPASFNKAGDLMAFTRNNYQGKSKEGIIKLQLFTSEYTNEKWHNPVSMPFNSDDYSTGHPSYTPDGKMMYFASDMPGGFGGVDLYRIYRRADGSWTIPENLGDKINTEGDEMFPFVHPDGMIFFASNGLPGLGGLDIFCAQITEKGFGEPRNIGSPVNSNFDDFALILNDNQTSGYFSSNRSEGLGEDDIYSFRLLKPFKFDKLLRGRTMDMDSNILSNVRVNLYNEDGNQIATRYTNLEGNYEFVINEDKFYSIAGAKEGYKDGHNTADSHVENYLINRDLILDKIPKFSIYFLVTDSRTGKSIENVKIRFIDYIEHKNEIILTPKSGDIFRKLLGKEINDTISYEIALEKKGYMSETLLYNTRLYREGQYNIHEDLNFKMHKVEEGMDLSTIININPIYFDLNESYIRPDAAIELDKIVKVMNDNPNMEIELGSHTDCRGSFKYNMDLSDKRAKSSALYIKERISDPERIYGKGYGESKLINHCECEGSKNVPCTEEEHQLNRRTEFRILAM